MFVIMKATVLLGCSQNQIIFFFLIFFYFFPVCQGFSNRVNLMDNKEDHYLNMVKTYSNCTIVLENLEITHVDENRDLSFLKVKAYTMLLLHLKQDVIISMFYKMDNLNLNNGFQL